MYSGDTVNVLKFKTLYSILFWPKFYFLCSCFLNIFNYLVEWQIVQTQIRLLLQEQSDLGLHCLHMSFCHKTLGFKILGYLLYSLEVPHQSISNGEALLFHNMFS